MSKKPLSKIGFNMYASTPSAVQSKENLSCTDEVETYGESKLDVGASPTVTSWPSSTPTALRS